MFHGGEFGLETLRPCGESVDNCEPDILADRLKLAALIARHENRTAIRPDLPSGIPILETLVDYRDVEGELGLYADLKAVFDADQKDVPALGLGIGYPFAGMLAFNRFDEGGTEICLALEALLICLFPPHNLARINGAGIVSHCFSKREGGPAASIV